MPKTPAGTGLKSRKRKAKDVEPEDVSDLKMARSMQPAKGKKQSSEDDVEERKLVATYCSEKAYRQYRMISKLMNEFNCNSKDMKIYCREYEKSQIKDYIDDNFSHNKSGLMYVCGHPGTGKSSIIRVILSELEKRQQEDAEYRSSLMIFNYNGMIFKKLFDFSTELIKDIRAKLYGKKSKNIESKLKQTDDVIDLGNRIQKYFHEFKHIHKVVIIDEVDNLSMTESAKNFVSFLHSILKSETNTTIIGIANSVDLLSKVCNTYNKENDLVEKKWVFEPYSDRNIKKIVEKKLERFQNHTKCTYKLIDEKALEYASKKVAKISGDIRVAFDLIKSATIQLLLKYREEAMKKKREVEGISEDETINEEQKDENSSPNEGEILKPVVDIENPKIDYKMLLYLINNKFGMKSFEIIKTLPSHLILILKTLVYVFDDKNVNKSFKANELYTANLRMLDKLNLGDSNISDFWQALKTLESYGIINYTEGKNVKAGKVSLKADIDEIKNGLDAAKLFHSK